MMKKESRWGGGGMEKGEALHDVNEWPRSVNKLWAGHYCRQVEAGR